MTSQKTAVLSQNLPGQRTGVSLPAMESMNPWAMVKFDGSHFEPVANSPYDANAPLLSVQLSSHQP